MARITEPTCPVAPTTPIFMADQANGGPSPLARNSRSRQPSPCVAAPDAPRPAARAPASLPDRSGAARPSTNVADEPPVTGVDAFERLVPGAGDVEREALRGPHDAHVRQVRADRPDDLLRAEP